MTYVWYVTELTFSNQECTFIGSEDARTNGGVKGGDWIFHCPPKDDIESPAEEIVGVPKANISSH